MRITFVRFLAFLVVVLNITALYHVWRLFFATPHNKRAALETKSADRTGIFKENSLTIVIRCFEHFENDVAATVRSLRNAFPKLPLLIISHMLPYPPLNIPQNDSVKVLSLNINLDSSFEERNPLHHIKTKYVLVVPDAVRVSSYAQINKMVMELNKQHGVIVSASFLDSKTKCLKIKLNVKQWTLEYTSLDGVFCDSVSGRQLVLAKTSTLKNLPDPFLLPFPESLYIQAAAKKIKIKKLHTLAFRNGKPLFSNKHARWKHEQSEQRKSDHMFRALGIKKVVRETGVVEWYGCARETARCFPTVVDDIPQYLWQGKWTPPCCLEALRRTARHVLNRLASSGVRHWLEGGSLLGAMRYGDIIPWDYDVDLGIYRDDIPLCPWLVRTKNGPVIDDEGFVWEKATEGKFYRVQFSKTNHLHVDLFPFYERNGTMTKDSWFRTHVQDREFPEKFLHPVSDIEFVGLRAPAPNNIHEFLEFKFGKGVVEHPEYPNPEKLKFTREEKVENAENDDPYDY